MVRSIVVYGLEHALAPRIYEGGGRALARSGGVKLRCFPNSPSQKSKIFDSPLLKAGAEAASPLGAVNNILSYQADLRPLREKKKPFRFFRNGFIEQKTKREY